MRFVLHRLWEQLYAWRSLNYIGTKGTDEGYVKATGIYHDAIWTLSGLKGKMRGLLKRLYLPWYYLIYIGTNWKDAGPIKATGIDHKSIWTILGLNGKMRDLLKRFVFAMKRFELYRD